jgi:putative ATP-dependent endonuclease of OLD family
MRISEVKIKNFRAFKNETVKLGDYTSMVGPNGAGKSTVLTALRIFFRDTADTVTDLQSLSQEDFNNKDTSQDIEITVVFEDLSEQAAKDLQHYYRHGKLVVSAVAHWDPGAKRAEVRQYGERLGMREFADFFQAEKDGSSVSELKLIYEALRSAYLELPAQKTKPQMVDALREFEEAHADRLVPLRSSDQFYGFTKGDSLLKNYVQWIFVPAVKDASSENMEGKKNALRTILERTVRARINFDQVLEEIRSEAEDKYRAVLAEQQNTLREISESLTRRVSRWAHPDASVTVQWDQEASKYVSVGEPLARVFGKEGEFEGDLSRFGHGFQRSYLLALLQELSGCLDSGEPKLILACEEPELHQHPPQARHMAEVLELLARRNTQVIVSSHSPHFVRGMGFEDVRLVRYDRESGQAVVKAAELEAVAQLIAKSLGEKPVGSTALAMKIEQTLEERVKEMFFSPTLILVEGHEDIGYVESYVALLEIKESLRAHGCHIVPTIGKDRMIRPLAIATLLDIPTFVIFDADGGNKENEEQNRRLNTAILRLCGLENPDPFPAEMPKFPNVWVWPTNVGDVVRSEIGHADWDKAALNIGKQRAFDVGGMAKNHVFIGQVLCAAWEEGRKSPALEDLCRAVMSFAIRQRAEVATVLPEASAVRPAAGTRGSTAIPAE